MKESIEDAKIKIQLIEAKTRRKEKLLKLRKLDANASADFNEEINMMYI